MLGTRCGSSRSATSPPSWSRRSALVFYRAFEHGFGAGLGGGHTPEALHALWLTLLIAAIAVPLNTVFGVLCALVLVRQRFRGEGS